MFIDIVGHNTILDRLTLVYIYPEIPLPGQKQTRKTTLSVGIKDFWLQNPFFRILQQVSNETQRQIRDLKAWIVDFLSDNRGMVASLEGRNRLNGSGWVC